MSLGSRSERQLTSRKVRVPRVDGLERERLTAILDQIWTHRIALVAAPAGCGKTTLLRQFVFTAKVPTVWLRAEESGASGPHFLAHLGEAVSAVLGIAPTAWKSLGHAISVLDDWDVERGLIVIDDLHSLLETEAESLIEELLEGLPDSLRILAATRVPPDFNLSRLRVSGQLLELGADELRFRSWEVERLFRDFYGEPLPPEDLAELARRTEGWAAGLQLFHLATQGKPADIQRHTLAQLSGKSRLVREYLARNVLQELPISLRGFLIETSVLDLLSGPICDKFRGTSGSAELLGELERRQMFTYPLEEEGAYRYHEVLRSHLEAILREEVGEEEFKRRYRLAASLLEGVGAIAGALRSYCRGEDWDSVGRILGRRGEELAQDPGIWIDSLPRAVFEQDPWVQLALARRLLSSGRFSDAILSYQRAEQSFGSTSEVETSATERQNLQAWLEPGPARGRDWPGLMRAAVRDDPLAVASQGMTQREVHHLLAAAFATLVAGHAESARTLSSRILSDPEAGSAVVAGARLISGIAGFLSGSPDASAETEQAAEEFEEMGATWPSRLARSALALAGGPGIREAMSMKKACDESGDLWGASLAALFAGLGQLESTSPPKELLYKAAESFDQLDARVLSGWARCALAYQMAHSGDQSARTEAITAEALARTTGAHGVLALAYGALSMTDPKRAEECQSLELALRDEFGFSLGISRENQSRLIGRTRELRDLRAVLDSVVSGSSAVVSILGEPGIGKTRLAKEFSRQAEAAGALVLWGRCTEAEPAYWPWLQVIRSFVERFSAAELEARFGPEALEIAGIVPEVTEELGADEAKRREPDRLQFRLFEVFGGFIKRTAEHQPLVVILDDLHWADSSSLMLLQFLAREYGDWPVLFVVAYRDRLAAGSELEHVVSDLTRVHELPLGGLEPEAVARLMQSTSGVLPPPYLVQAIHSATRGNPFFVRETTRMLQLEGWLDDPNNRIQQTIQLPQSVREVIVRRADRLSQDANRVLGIASVVGENFDLDELGILTAMSRDELLLVLDEAIQDGVVHRTGTNSFSFSHSEIQDTLYGRLPDHERREVHAALGKFLEKSTVLAFDGKVTDIANHFLRAHPLESKRALTWAIKAARFELASAAYEDAVAYCEAAIDLGIGREPSEEAELHVLLGDAWRKCGKPTFAREAIFRSIEAARVAGDPALFARCVIGYGAIYGETGSIDHDLIRLLEEALRWLPPTDSTERALILSRLGAALYSAPNTEQRRVELVTEALSSARKLGDPATLSAVLTVSHWTIWRPDQIGERLEVANEAISLGEQVRDLEGTLIARRARMHDLLELGDLSGFDVDLAVHGRLSDELRDPGLRWHTAVYRTMRALLDGRFVEAEQLMDKALELGQEAGNPVAPQYYALHLGMLRSEQGRLEEIQGGIRSFIEQYPTVPAWRAASALIGARLGRRVEAGAELSRLVSERGPELPHDWHWLASSCILADACAELSDDLRARVLYETLLPWAEHNAVSGVASLFLGPVHFYLGRLAATLTSYEQASRHFDKALKNAALMGARPIVARIQLAYAETLLERGEPADIVRIKELIDACLGTAHDLGMTEIENRSLNLLQSNEGEGHLVEVRCFGEFKLVVNGREIDLSTVKPRPRSLLRLLALKAGQPIHREFLIEALWPDIDAASGTRNLQVAISSIRRLIEPDRDRPSLIIRQGDAYKLELNIKSSSDVRAFDDALIRGRSLQVRGDSEGAISAFEEVLVLYAGELFPVEGPAEWVVGERERYRSEAVEAVHSLTELLLDSGNPLRAIAICERGLHLDRFRDGLWRLLERAYLTAGDHAAAEKARRDYQSVLGELGLSR